MTKRSPETDGPEVVDQTPEQDNEFAAAIAAYKTAYQTALKAFQGSNEGKAKIEKLRQEAKTYRAPLTEKDLGILRIDLGGTLVDAMAVSPFLVWSLRIKEGLGLERFEYARFEPEEVQLRADGYDTGHKPGTSGSVFSSSTVGLHFDQNPGYHYGDFKIKPLAPRIVREITAFLGKATQQNPGGFEIDYSVNAHRRII